MNNNIEKLKPGSHLNKLLVLVAFGEVSLGLILLIYPLIIVKLLFNTEIDGVGLAVCRVLGISLIAFGFSCWPYQNMAGNNQKCWAMIIYNLLVTFYLSYLGIFGQWVGYLLWPVVILHALLIILFVREWLDKLYGLNK